MYSSILSSTCITVNTDLMLWAKVDALFPSAQGSKTWNQCRQPWAIDLKLAFKIFDLGMFREGGDGLTAWVYFLVVFLVFFFLFIFLSFPFLLPPQSGAGKGKLTRSLAVCEESSARPGGESLQDQVYALSLRVMGEWDPLCVHEDSFGIKQCFGGSTN